jgi:hypothetical protein
MLQPQLASWCLIKHELGLASLSDLRAQFAALSPDYRQVGVDDTVLGLEWFTQERMHKGTELLQNAYLPALRQYAKTGIPQSLRSAYYARLLGVSLPLSAKDAAYFQSHLLHSVGAYTFITDALQRFDIQEAVDSEEFFVFEEALHAVMMAFSRDAHVPEKSAVTINTAVIRVAAAQPRGGAGSAPAAAASGESIHCVPPNHVVPFHRQVFLCAPLAFIFAAPAELYFGFRALYLRHWCKLHTISSAPEAVVSLSKTFEDLLIARAPQVFFHCTALGVPPLAVAFPWLFSAFSGWLQVDQVLLLWDRIVAFDSLLLLPAAAAAIFTFRAKFVLQAKTQQEIHDIFRELCNLQIIPLLQHFLFATDSTPAAKS